MEGQTSRLDPGAIAGEHALNAAPGEGAVVLPLPSSRQLTEREALEAELRVTKAELERRTEELDQTRADLEQLAYVVSHDLSQPLTTVSGFAEMLARRYRGRLDTDANEFIYFIVNGARRLQRMLDDLLTYSRVGRQAELEQTVNCGAVVRDVVESFHSAIVELEAKVSIGKLPSVRGNGEQLTEVFRRLIQNALEYAGEEPPRIHVSGEREHNGFCFAVSDEGTTIKGKHADRVFQIFQRLHPHDSHTGAGLAICKRIVERHGGSIWVEPAPNGGNRFVFTIPDRVGES